MTMLRPETKSDWMNKVPDGWRIIPLKRYFSFGKGLPITKADLVETGEKVISYGQIHAKYNSGVHVDQRLVRFVPTTFLTSHPSSLCTKGDIIIADTSEDREGCGNAVYIDTDEPIFAGYHTIILRSDNDNKYLAYLFLSDAWRYQLRRRVQGVKLFSITQRILSQCSIVLPPSEEQRAITVYLDDRCSRIDEIIAEATASIEEYKKLRKTVIANSVLFGLNKDVQTRNTGENWCQTIPIHWRFERGKYLFKETNNRSIDGSEELLTVSQYTGITPRSMKNVTMFEATSLVDYKICEIGDIATNTMWMWAGAVGVSDYYGVISPSYNTYRQINMDYNSKYLDYLLRAVPLVSEYESLSTGIRASRLRLYPSQFLAIRFPVPPIAEQKSIVEYLNLKIAEMDDLISEKQSLIEDLQAYKKSLIYEVVTGKRRVV